MQIEVADHEIIDEPLEYRADDHAFRARYVRRTSAPKERRAVLIAPDWRGISDYSIQQAKQLARLGYDVAIADLYGAGLCATEESQAKPLIQGLIGDRPGLNRRMSACLAAFSAALPKATPIAALGYSIGGMALLDLGRSEAAGVPLAGIVLTSALLRVAEVGAPTRINAPLLILHGSRDVVCPMDVVSALVSELDQASSSLRLVLYGQTGHAFYNPEAGTDPNARLVYSAEVDQLSQQEILLFFSQRLAHGQQGERS